MRRVLQERARDRESLPLTARQPLPPLADGALVALRQRRDELVRVRGARRRLDFLARRVGPAVRDVAADGVVEEDGLLSDDADLRAKRGQRHVADVDAVDEDRRRP